MVKLALSDVGATAVQLLRQLLPRLQTKTHWPFQGQAWCQTNTGAWRTPGAHQPSSGGELWTVAFCRLFNVSTALLHGHLHYAHNGGALALLTGNKACWCLAEHPTPRSCTTGQPGTYQAAVWTPCIIANSFKPTVCRQLPLACCIPPTCPTQHAAL